MLIASCGRRSLAYGDAQPPRMWAMSVSRVAAGRMQRVGRTVYCRNIKACRLQPELAVHLGMVQAAR